MAIKNRQELKNKFVSGAYPTQQDFWDWLDSYVHKNDKIDIEVIDGLNELLNKRNEAILEEVNRIVGEAQKELQLQRRIALTMERTTQIIPIGEDLTIYKASGSNLSKLEIKPNDVDVTEWVEIPLNSDISIDLFAAVFNYVIRITPTDNMISASIYLFAKAKQI